MNTLGYRPVWPRMLVFSVLQFLLTGALDYWHRNVLVVLSGIVFLILMISTLVTLVNGSVRAVKPRGWRKLSRQAEQDLFKQQLHAAREEYIKNLEDQVLRSGPVVEYSTDIDTDTETEKRNP